jgi:hypothetical protein
MAPGALTANLPLLAYPAPGLAKLSEGQRGTFLSILHDIESTGFARAKLDAMAPELVTRMASISVTDDEQQRLVSQLDDWVRWYPLGGYYLAYLFQSAMQARGSLSFISACLLFADAQNHFADDLSLVSLENAYTAWDSWSRQVAEDSPAKPLLARLSEHIRGRGGCPGHC